jgi:hypothetical protein
MKLWHRNKNNEHSVNHANPVNPARRWIGARRGEFSESPPLPLPPPRRTDSAAAPPTAPALALPQVARAEGILASRPVNLLGYLLTCPQAPLPDTEHDRPESPHRPNRVLDNWQRALADENTGALEDEHLTICPYTHERLVRPVWCPNGNSISEAALAQAMGAQVAGLAARRVDNPGLPPLTTYAAEDNTRFHVEQLRLNRPLMWALDQHAMRDAPLHRMVLADDGAGLRQALAELQPEPGNLIESANRRVGQEGVRPLVLAAKWGKLGAMEALLDNPLVFAELTDAYGTTALWHLADRGDVVGMQQLFAARGRRVELHCPRDNVKGANAFFGDGVTPLIAAFLHAHCAAVELLCSQGANRIAARVSHALSHGLLTRVEGDHTDPNCRCHTLLGLRPDPAGLG